MLSHIIRFFSHKRIARKLLYYTVTGVFFLILFAGLVVPGKANASTTEDQTISLINIERQKQNLPTLSFSDKLYQAASAHNSLMNSCTAKYGRTSCFVHTVSLLGEASLLNRIKALGYSPQSVAENIAWNYTTAQSVVAAWMGSSGHRANILGNYKDIGCSYATPYWTCDFGASFVAGSSATPTPTKAVQETLTPTPTVQVSPTLTITPTPTIAVGGTTPDGKPWWCAYIPTFSMCR